VAVAGALVVLMAGGSSPQSAAGVAASPPVRLAHELK